MAQLRLDRPPRRRTFGNSVLKTIALLAAALGVAAGSSCGTDAVGVSACRDIEYARCEAAVSCGLIDDAESCKRYYNDHCLHGVALDEGPGSVAVRNCVSSIRAAGRCADENDKSTHPEDCDSRRLSDANARRVCDIVEEPERAADCAFLVPEDEDDDKDDKQDDGKKDGGARSDAG
jgi:hypothetical protein